MLYEIFNKIVFIVLSLNYNHLEFHYNPFSNKYVRASQKEVVRSAHLNVTPGRYTS